MTNHGRGNASMSDGVSVLLALVGGTCPRRRRLPARRNADEIDARIWRAPSLAIVHEDNRKTRSFDYTANTSRKIRAAIRYVNFCATTPRMSTTFSTSQIPASRRLSRRHAGFFVQSSRVGRTGDAVLYAMGQRTARHGRVHSDFASYPQERFIHTLAAQVSREDASASIQKMFEDKLLLSIRRLLQRHKSPRLGVAGGAFANVRLNRVLAENLPIEQIFIFPVMGDEGMPAGGGLCYLLQRDGLRHWLSQRRELRDVYLGRDYTDSIDAALGAAADIRKTAEPPLESAAQRLTAGQLGAIYTGRMEYGPRALGTRSILANPSRRETHDLLNKRLARSEFIPFAPVIAADKASIVFDINDVNSYACRFMTITCNVKPQWRERIAAVVPRARRRSSARPIRTITTFWPPSSVKAAFPFWSIPASTFTKSRSSTNPPNVSKRWRMGGSTLW
jgi:hypothetical protein